MNKNLLKKIEAIYEKDQTAIREFKAGKISLDELRSINKKHTDFIADVIDKFGFPYKNTAFLKAYTGAFLVVQHSGNILLIEKVIRIFSEANDSQINRQDLAYLIDRLKVLKGLTQIYGTQYKVLQNNKIELLPIEDPSGINKRRKEMGMENLEDYLAKIEKNNT